MAKSHKLQVGDVTVAVLHEGGGPGSVDGLKQRYTNASEEEILAALGDNTPDDGSLNCVYIDNGETKILADVGFGIERQPEMGNVIPALAEIGVTPEDIDIIFITHFHGDHIAGLVTSDGSPAYPNARYVTQDAEWKEWIPRWEASDQDGHKQQLNMMKSLEDKFTFVNDGDTVADSVTVVSIPGHTMGQAGLLIESNGESLIHLADLLHNTLQLPNPHWHFSFDSDKELGVETRKSTLERCANENLRCVFYHLPFPAVGHVVKSGDVYEWQPE